MDKHLVQQCIAFHNMSCGWMDTCQSGGCLPVRQVPLHVGGWLLANPSATCQSVGCLPIHQIPPHVVSCDDASRSTTWVVAGWSPAIHGNISATSSGCMGESQQQCIVFHHMWLDVSTTNWLPQKSPVTTSAVFSVSLHSHLTAHWRTPGTTSVVFFEIFSHTLRHATVFQGHSPPWGHSLS